MGNTKIVGPYLIATIALSAVSAVVLSAVVSASASATNNPKWALCETRGLGGQWKNGACTELQANGSHETRLLLTNETRSIIAKANSVQKLSSPAAKITIVCNKLTLAGGTLRGGEPAGDSETIVYKECTVEGYPNCRVRNKGGTFGTTIETKPMHSTVGYASKEAEEKENQAATVTVFAPASGKAWFEMEMETECPEKTLNIALPIEGELTCEDVGNEHLVEHEINCPSPRISTYWLQSGGSPKEEKVKKLEIVRFEATYTGKSTISLAGSQLGQEFWLD